MKNKKRKKEQLYCVVATCSNVRQDISGPLSQERAKQLCETENSISSRKRICKYPKVVRYPYKSKVG